MYNCDEIFDKTDDYFEGNLTDYECAAFEYHLKICENCRKNVEFARNLEDVMHSMPSPQPSGDLLEKLHNQIGEKKKVSIYRKWQPYTALAACIVLAVVIKTNAVKDLNTTSSYLDLSTPTPTIQAQTADMPSVDDEAEVSVQSAEEIALDTQADPTATIAPGVTPISTVKPAPTATAKPKATSQPKASDLPKASQPKESEKSTDTLNSGSAAATASADTAAQSLENAPAAASLTDETTAAQSQPQSRSAVAASGGSAKSGGATTSVGGGTLKPGVNNISSAHKQTVQSIIGNLGIVSNRGVYSTTSTIYNEFVIQMSNAGIPFQGVCTRRGDNVTFVINWI